MTRTETEVLRIKHTPKEKHFQFLEAECKDYGRKSELRNMRQWLQILIFTLYMKSTFNKRKKEKKKVSSLCASIYGPIVTLSLTPHRLPHLPGSSHLEQRGHSMYVC